VLGMQTIIPANRPVLAAGLPYHLIAKGNVFSQIPDNLRHSITINLYHSEMDRILSSPALSYSINLLALKIQRFGVTYEPASKTDAVTLQSYYDSGATALPLYLIQVKPVIKIDTVVVATGTLIGMGQPQYFEVVMTAPWGTERVLHNVIAGNEIVFGVNAVGITSEQVQARFSAVNANTAAENLHQVALHYWMEYDLFNQLIAKAVGIHTFRLPSVGLFSSPLTVDFLFGIPKSGFYRSRSMDLKYTRMSVAGSTLEEVISFTKRSGIYGSYLEGSIFEQLFRRTQGSGISAVQLLLDASAQQIPIYTLDSQNADQILPRLAISEEVKTEIRNALNVGKIAILSAREPAKGSWSGIGYLIQDPKTGGGAYMIDGGLNGGGLVEECGKPETVPLVQAIQAILMTTIIIAMLAAIIYELPVLVGAGVAAGGKVIVTLQVLMASMGMTFLAFPAYSGEPVVRILYHYTNRPEANFAGGMWSQTHATDVSSYTGIEATIKLGATPYPDKIIPVCDRGYFRFIGIVREHKWGEGGGTDYINEVRVPSEDILPAIPIH